MTSKYIEDHLIYHNKITSFNTEILNCFSFIRVVKNVSISEINDVCGPHMNPVTINNVADVAEINCNNVEGKTFPVP